jgi:calcyphosin
MTSGMMSCDNPFSNITQYYDNTDPCKRIRPSLANDTLPKPNNKPGYLNMTGKESENMTLDSSFTKTYSQFMQENKKPD